MARRKRKGSAPAFGYNDDWRTLPGSALKTARKGGATTARIPVSEANSFGQIDGWVKNLRRQGIKPLFVAAQGQGSTTGTTASASAANTRAGAKDYGRWVGQLSKRYGKGAAGIEVGNEPNIGGLGAKDYSRTLKQAKKASKGSKTKLIAAAPAPLTKDNPAMSGKSWTSYLRQVAKRAPKGIDYAAHIYPTHPKVTKGGVGKVYKKVKKITGKNPWVTEVGASSNPEFGNPKKQGKQLSKYYKKLSKKGAKGIFVHTLQPNQAPTSPFFEDTDVAGKPAFKALKRARRQDIRRRRR